MARSYSLLVADDEENDIFLLRVALQRAQIPLELIVARDGWEALDYLERLPAALDKHPGLFLLDLKMPNLSGFDVLDWMARGPHLVTLPVVVLTSSPRESDRHRAREAGARDYFAKPPDLDGLASMLGTIYNRYFL